MIRHLQSSILTLEEKNMISSPMRFIINFNFFVSLSHTENPQNGRYYQEDNFWAAREAVQTIDKFWSIKKIEEWIYWSKIFNSVFWVIWKQYSSPYVRKALLNTYWTFAIGEHFKMYIALLSLHCKVNCIQPSNTRHIFNDIFNISYVKQH